MEKKSKSKHFNFPNSLQQAQHNEPGLIPVYGFVSSLLKALLAAALFSRLLTNTLLSRGHYVGIHTSNFQDFILKPELLRAIVDCGFEHPSEGKEIIYFLLKEEDEGKKH
jgi:hypothetical protein